MTISDFQEKNAKILDFVGAQSSCHVSCQYQEKIGNNLRKVDVITDHTLPWLDLDIPICDYHDVDQFLINAPRRGNPDLLGSTSIDYASKKPKKPSDLAKLEISFNYFDKR